jgi:hypothetical protein
MASKRVLAWVLAVAGAAVPLLAAAQAASDNKAAPSGSVMAIVKAGQAGLYRKAGGKIAARVLIEGETVYVVSTTQTDGYFSVTLDDEKTSGWMKAQDLQIIGERGAGNVVKSQ